MVSVTVEGAGSDVSRYLAIETGRPLDPAQVRRTVELLHATGAYEDVVVEEDDAPGGKAITIRLVAAPLLTEVVVEGDARRLAAARSARSRACAPGEPLWPERLESAARDVAVDLGRRGYLEARVTAAARRDGGRGGGGLHGGGGAAGARAGRHRRVLGGQPGAGCSRSTSSPMPASPSIASARARRRRRCGRPSWSGGAGARR